MLKLKIKMKYLSKKIFVANRF